MSRSVVHCCCPPAVAATAPTCAPAIPTPHTILPAIPTPHTILPHDTLSSPTSPPAPFKHHLIVRMHAPARVSARHRAAASAQASACARLPPPASLNSTEPPTSRCRRLAYRPRDPDAEYAPVLMRVFPGTRLTCLCMGRAGALARLLVCHTRAASHAA